MTFRKFTVMALSALQCQWLLERYCCGRRIYVFSSTTMAILTTYNWSCNLGAIGIIYSFICFNKRKPGNFFIVSRRRTMATEAVSLGLSSIFWKLKFFLNKSLIWKPYKIYIICWICETGKKIAVMIICKCTVKVVEI